MEIYSIEDKNLRLRVSADCGAIIDGFFRDKEMFRSFSGDESGELNAVEAASFPLVPFGNRVAGNRFVFEGREHSLERNTNWDKHYVHGEGWISKWDVTHHDATAMGLSFHHEANDGTPYSYRSKQTFLIRDETLSLGLSVENTGERPLLFGAGHHFFFPLTPLTTLQARATGFWTEKHDYLPDKKIAVPERLDFSSPRELPREWVNNGFDGWDGEATICWPEKELTIHIQAGNEFSDYFVFVSDTRFEPGFKHDYFCFEPMTHTANGHLIEGYGGLRRLDRGEKLATEVVLKPRLL